MDTIDEQLIAQLRKDSRTPFLKMARALEISEGTVRQRVKKLIGSVITQFTIRTSNEVGAIVGIESDTCVETSKIVHALKGLGIERVFELTGRFDIVCFIHSKSMGATNDMLERIRSVKGITHTETFTVLKES